MTKDDDDLDEVMGSMRSMRSVWMDMREEEPPARGFAELMAAARIHAETMKPEKEVPWWRRGFAMLLRPPMLAAATVVVLIGGAVVLSQRGADAPTASTATESRPAQRGDEDLRAKQGDLERDAKQVVPPAIVAPEPSIQPGTLDGAASPAPVRRPRPTPAIVRETTKHESGAAANVGDKAQNSAPVAADKGEGLHIAGEDEGGTDPVPKKVIKPITPSIPETTERAPAPVSTDSVSVTAVRPAQRPTQPPIDQLISQAETAAKRNDCAAVKATAERIRKLDGAAYKGRVVTQPAIARCLK